jgi:hypothetical protein
MACIEPARADAAATVAMSNPLKIRLISLDH